MFRTYSNFDKLLEKATSNLRLDPDWPSILQICDLIRQNDCTPKYAVTAIKKKLSSPNPHQAMFALLVLESIVKNCGSGVHEEIASVANCESYRAIVKSQTHENVRTKILELMQAWASAFRNISKYRTVQDAVNILKAEGYKFPVLKESDAMFAADSAPEWSDGDVCHRCRVPFSLMQRKHHCRACGQVFCQQCSAKTTTLPKFGIEKEVRVCDACLEKVNKPIPGAAAAKTDAVDTIASYVTSTASPENQASTPKTKTAEELREEEEIQLALALSQSEAEQKEKEKQRSISTHTSPAATQHHGSPPSSAPPAELSRYLDRNYWEQRVQPSPLQLDPPSAPTPSPGPAPVSGISEMMVNKLVSMKLENGNSSDPEMDEFVSTLKSQVEIFVNRMKSNSSRGRSIANDSSVQTLFMNLTAMHSRLLRYIQQQDDNRVHYEGLQDKLTQVKDSRAALDVLREEHAERVRRAAEQAELQRQLQMAHKLDVMRKKKQEYLQYQRQLALQRVQEQEREMQMRQEQQKHQYMIGGPGNFYIQGSPVHQFHGNQQPQPPYGQGYPGMMPGLHQQSQMVSDNPNMMRQGPPNQGPQGNQLPQPNMPLQQVGHLPPMNMQVPGMPPGPQLTQIGQHPPGMGTLQRQPGPQMGQLPQMNQLQGPQLPHMQQMNKPPQTQQNMQQPPHMGPQAQHMGPQMLPQHGPPMGPQHGQQMPPQMNQQPNQPPQQMHPKGHPMMYMDPEIGQMMHMMQNMNHMNPQMGPPPGHQPQPMNHMPNQMPQNGQMNKMNPNHMPPNNQPSAGSDTKVGIVNQMGPGSPTSAPPPNIVTPQAPPVTASSPQTVQSPIPIPVVEETSTAELIKFD